MVIFKTLSDLEVQIVKMVPQLDDSTCELLAYHWSNYTYTYPPTKQ